jgi:[ribosomal protein S5]-alanine N-acetyltransferase
MQIVEASVCRLEPQTAAHAEEMFILLCDPAIYEFENAPPSSQAWLHERYTRLEARRSPDGTQTWLNWVVRLPGGKLAGYVQATVIRPGVSVIAYELASRFWRQGIGQSAVTAMLAELQLNYGVTTFAAVLKAANYRSLGLLRSLGFQPASIAQALEFGPEHDEAVLIKPGPAAQEDRGGEL